MYVLIIKFYYLWDKTRDFVVVSFFLQCTISTMWNNSIIQKYYDKIWLEATHPLFDDVEILVLNCSTTRADSQTFIRSDRERERERQVQPRCCRTCIGGIYRDCSCKRHRIAIAFRNALFQNVLVFLNKIVNIFCWFFVGRKKITIKFNNKNINK